ncbi:MAG: hypothetical protein ACRDP4_05875, partial [Nocardioidaceae bacterium]
DAPAATLHLLVRNINIRKVGQDCSGAGAYLFIHHSARFRIEDEGGDVVATGQIPVGTAAQAFDDDLGVSRVPTFCEFTMPVRLDVRDGYRLRVRGHEPIGLHAAGHRHPRALVAVVP